MAARATRRVDGRRLGPLAVEVVDGLLFSVGFPEAQVADAGGDPTADAVADWLRAYLAGPVAPLRVPLAERGTAFQRRVWSAVMEVPWGETRTYGEVAAVLGEPGAVRAVGAANGANPFLLVVPCHRIVGADGSLTGYAAGLERKRWLLGHEGSRPALLPF